MRLSKAFDPELHEPGSAAAQGRCSYHSPAGGQAGDCTGEAVVSFQDEQDGWIAGCSLALKELVDREEIEPLGQKA